jgi:hypothetical protein
MNLTALWRALWPFWQFQDASRGDLYARAAAERHNLRLRATLPPYLARWGLVCALAALAIRTFDSLAADVGHKLDVFVVMAAGSGLICAYAICAVLTIGYAYLCLGRLSREAPR